MRVEQFIAIVVGFLIAGSVLASALRTVVLPQGQLTGVTRFVFAVSDRLFTSSNRHRILPRRLAGLYAPVALVSLPFAWSMLIALGFTLVFWGLDVGSLSDAWVTSGSSLFTLGFAKPDTGGPILVTFLEATIGLGIVALLISYLPTLYTAYSAREQGVGLLAPLTGRPPAATELLRRLHAAHALEDSGLWAPTSQWFVALNQNHAAFPALARFPPQDPHQNWVVTAGTVLDAAALRLSVADTDHRPTGADGGPGVNAVLGPLLLVLAHGIPALVNIGRANGLAIEEPPPLLGLLIDQGEEPPPISVDREEYEAAVAVLAETGVIGPVDNDEGWRRFRWLRSGYDTPLRGLAGLTHAPPAPWTSDRALAVGRPRFFSRRPVDMTEP